MNTPAPKKHHPGFLTVNINVKSNPEMGQKQVVHDVRRAAQQAGLIGWNEISPKRYFQAIKQLGPDWNHYMPKDGGLRIPNPISWKKSVWKKEDAGFLRTHHGLAKVSPNRYITWVKLKHRKTGKEIVRINTHLVSGAWGKHKPTTEWRRKMWNIHMEKLDKLVNHFEKKGLDVVIGGDFNRDSYKLLGKDVNYDNNIHVGTHGKSTYDYLMHTKGGALRKNEAHVQHGYASDHDAVVASYSFGGGGKGAAPAPAQTGTATKKHAFTVATVNDDFTDKKSNLKKIDADVMLVQEAKNTNVHKLLKNRDVGVHQRFKREDKAGTAVVWDRDRMKATDRGYAMGVKPHGRKMLTRWINWTDVKIDGQTVRMASVHRPPLRFKALWPLFDAKLAAFVKNSDVPVIVGMDANQQNPQDMAKKTGLTWHAPPGSIDGFLVSKEVEVGKMWRLPKGTSDHHPVMARFRMKKTA